MGEELAAAGEMTDRLATREKRTEIRTKDKGKGLRLRESVLRQNLIRLMVFSFS